MKNITFLSFLLVFLAHSSALPMSASRERLKAILHRAVADDRKEDIDNNVNTMPIEEVEAILTKAGVTPLSLEKTETIIMDDTLPSL